METFSQLIKMSKKHRAYVFTLNNYTPEEVEEIKAWLCYYLSFGKEVGEVEHTRHLQGYVYFENAKTLSTLKKKYSSRANWIPAEATPKRASDYTKKGEQTKAEWEAQKEKGPNFGKNADVFEKGTLPLSQIEKGDKGKRKFEEAFCAYKERRYEDMGKFGLQMKQFEYLHAKCEARDRQLPAELETLQNEWHWGVPGCGKSHTRYELDNPFLKNCTRFWCGYKGQKDVFIEEFSKFKIEVTDLLKEWTGEHPFNAEIKCGSLGDIRPERTFVTSQDNPKNIFSPDDYEAIKRRFKIYHWSEPYYIGSKKENGRNPRWFDPRKDPVRAVLTGPEPPSPDRFTSLPSRFQ